ncbi:MAG: TlpA family protein disulfide reductase [Pirellulales bacterium]|nr:TlpA family protein disulfide reductase [Pirellulales bacterium]
MNLAAQVQAAEGLAANTTKSPVADIFPLPEEAKSFQDVFNFVREIDSRETSGMHQDEMQDYQRKVARSVLAIAEKVLKEKLENQDLMQTVAIKLQALEVMDDLGEPRADKLFAQAIKKATQDEHPDVRAVGMKYLVESGFKRWDTMNAKERKAWRNHITAYLQEVENLQMLMAVIDFLSAVGGEHLSKDMLAELLPVFRKSGNPRLVTAAGRLEGIARRMNLPGNKIEMQGMLLDGTQLNWSAYRGKVVLVDFWATWCGPCRVEVPNLLRLYNAYHEKGFDVLGISLDKTAKEAEEYIAQMEIPWATLFSEDKGQRGWQHPLAVHYGINGIPRAILVDRDGTVVHMNARGGILANELRRMLGEPASSK